MRYIQRKNAVVFKFTAPTPTGPSLPQGFAWALISHESLREFFPGRAHKRRLTVYRRLLSEGYMGFLVHDYTEWAAIQWMATPESPAPPHLTTGISQDKYWCFNEHTREEHRQTGLWKMLKSIGIRHVRSSVASPATVIYSDTHVDNIPSRRAHQSFGFKPHGTIGRLSIIIPKVTVLNFGTWETEQAHPPL